jgi:hypothetical protein
MAWRRGRVTAVTLLTNHQAIDDVPGTRPNDSGCPECCPGGRWLDVPSVAPVGMRVAPAVMVRSRARFRDNARRRGQCSDQQQDQRCKARHKTGLFLWHAPSCRGDAALSYQHPQRRIIHSVAFLRPAIRVTSLGRQMTWNGPVVIHRQSSQQNNAGHCAHKAWLPLTPCPVPPRPIRRPGHPSQNGLFASASASA